MPDLEIRFLMCEKLLEGKVESAEILTLLAQHTDGYSGADVVNVVKEAAMRPLRRCGVCCACHCVSWMDAG